MATDGSEFWICRADGGSVRFLWDSNYGFQAKEIFDPHGLKTTLKYEDGRGNLSRVEQEGGRFLNIIWAPYSGGAYMISEVQSGTDIATGAVSQRVTYYYAQVDGYWTLQQVRYENEDFPGGAPGQKIAATYVYGTCYGNGPEPCSGDAKSVLPVLKHADDPHYDGPLAIINYTYRGVHCPPHLVRPWDWPMYVPAQVWAIASEKSYTGLPVSSFTIECDSGKRREDNGLGAWRMFYFGPSAGTHENTPNGPFLCRGYQLGKLTDFTREGGISPNLPYEKQNFRFGDPRHIWDGRGIMTEAIAGAQDDSGEPAEVRYVDGSAGYFNRVNPGTSAALDPSQGMHNSYNHWLFSQTRQLNSTTNHTTTYTRDSRRRVTQIDYPGGSSESFVYDNGLPNKLIR